MNALYYGDNLAVMRDRAQFPDQFVDLIYLDPSAWPKPLQRGEGPPFNSKRDGGEVQTKAVEDNSID